MANTAATSPGTMADDATVGMVAWSIPNNAKVSDNVYAAAITDSGEYSHYLKATNFGFSIPNGATINGILVEVEAYKYRINSFSAIKIVKADGTIGTTNKTATISTTEAYISLGSSSDLWGVNDWTAEKINDIDFGVVVQNTGAGHAYVDHIRITVYYTEAPPVTFIPKIIFID